jgi:DNA-binding XRE family transcriptional regulator
VKAFVHTVKAYEKTAFATVSRRDMGRNVITVHTYRGQFHPGPHRPTCHLCKLKARAGKKPDFDGRKKRAKVLRSARRKLGISQIKMAERLKVSADQFVRWERGDSDMSASMQRRVERKLKLAYGELV